MEYVDGQTLRAVLAAGPVPTKKLLRLATQIAGGLAKAHSVGIVHRDLKPENIMLTRDGFVKILDFGLAKLAAEPSEAGSEVRTVTRATQEGVVLGTVQYMSPEQAAGRPVDHHSDQFSLGSILYEMATGTFAYQRDTEPETQAAIMRDEPEPVSALNPLVPAQLVHIIGRCLEKEPQQRYDSTRDLARELEGVDRLSTGPEAASPRPGRLPMPGVVGLGVVAILVAMAVALYTGGLPEWIAGDEGSPRIESIAVLPLENLSGDPEQEYFADGMTEELNAELAKIGALRVISRQSVMQFKGSDTPLPRIARALKVDAVVQGSVLRSGDRARITAQLIQADPERHLWAESYERELRDVLSVQSEIAEAIVNEIQVKLTPGERGHLAARDAVHPDAHEAYLRGQFHWNQGTPESFLKAIDFFDEATRIDPSYTRAYAKLAESYALFAAFPKAKLAAARALELDDSLAESHAAVGVIRLLYELDWVGAETELLRALELNPNYPTAHHFYSWYLCAIGKMEEAVEEFERAIALDPLSLFANGDYGVVLYLSHYYERAVEQLLKTLELDPDFHYAHWWLGLAYLETGETGKALEHLREAVRLSPDHSKIVAALGYGYAVTGDREEARKTLERLEEMSRTQWVPPYDVAMVYAGLNDKDAAFEWLDRALEERDIWLGWVKAEAGFENIRDDPRFEDLLRRMDFPE
jgi:TolB-like protein/Tfp pilus assembly protein PilF